MLSFEISNKCGIFFANKKIQSSRGSHMQQETGDSRPLPPCHNCIKSKWTIRNRNNQLFCLVKLYWTKTITNYPLNMPSSVSISLVILVWITTIIIINHVGCKTSITATSPRSKGSEPDSVVVVEWRKHLKSLQVERYRLQWWWKRDRDQLKLYRTA